MNVNEKIRVMREVKQWSQEEMAEKMLMSTNGYAKIERGETKLNLEKLQQIAQIFGMDPIDFMDNSNRGVFFVMNDNGDNTSANYYSNTDAIVLENEKLKLIVQHKDELLKQKETEIQMLKELNQLLKK